LPNLEDLLKEKAHKAVKEERSKRQGESVQDYLSKSDFRKRVENSINKNIPSHKMIQIKQKIDKKSQQLK
jgi:hypothetical protein